MRLGNDPTVVLNGLESRSEEKDLLQLTYLSQLVAPSVPAAYQHIQDILAVAIVKNPTMKIGGSLFFNPRTLQVLQALEGPQSAVQALYDKIAEDARHTSCTVISKLSVPTRTYDQWGMLQGDLADWSSLAAGKMSMSNIYARGAGGRLGRTWRRRGTASPRWPLATALPSRLRSRRRSSVSAATGRRHRWLFRQPQPAVAESWVCVSAPLPLPTPIPQEARPKQEAERLP